jgi:hypothetical protein
VEKSNRMLMELEYIYIYTFKSFGHVGVTLEEFLALKIEWQLFADFLVCIKECVERLGDHMDSLNEVVSKFFFLGKEDAHVQGAGI